MRKCTHRIVGAARSSVAAFSTLASTTGWVGSRPRSWKLSGQRRDRFGSTYSINNNDRGSIIVITTTSNSDTALYRTADMNWNKRRYYSAQAGARSASKKAAASHSLIPRKRAAATKKLGVKKEVFSYTDFMANDVKLNPVTTPTNTAYADDNDEMIMELETGSQSDILTDGELIPEERGEKPLSLMEQIRVIMDKNPEHVVLTEVGSFYEVWHLSKNNSPFFSLSGLNWLTQCCCNEFRSFIMNMRHSTAPS
jgi:hypothetical protein